MISMDSNDLYILDTLYVYMFDITWHYMQSLIPNWQVFIILFFFLFRFDKLLHSPHFVVPGGG